MEAASQTSFEMKTGFGQGCLLSHFLFLSRLGYEISYGGKKKWNPVNIVASVRRLKLRCQSDGLE